MYGSICTSGLMARADMAADCAFGSPIRSVVWAIWRCRLDSSNRSWSTMPMRADAGRRQIQRERRAEAAGADDQHARGLQLRLADAADVLQQDVPGVAADFVFGEIEVHGGRIW